MNEIEAILDACRGAAGRWADGVLATVVHVEGSAYRRPGARMLLLPNGERIGTISGGCLEGDVARKAWWMTESGRPVVRVYDTRSDDDAVWEFGLGCNGVIYVLLERLTSPGVRTTLDLLEDCHASRTPAALLTVIATEGNAPDITVGQRYFRDARGRTGGDLCGARLALELDRETLACLQAAKSHLAHLTDADVFVEYLAPPQRLVVFGAGHDAVPLVALAAQMGWHVTVVDGRPAYARAERFPGAKQVRVAPPEDPLAGVCIDPETAIVLMTHSFPLDCRLLPDIAARRPRYIGLLGSKARTERLCAETGVSPASLFAPVGLDIGAETPETIALSIISEIQAVLAGRAGGLLRERTGSIHASVREFGKRDSVRIGARVAPVCEIAA